MAEGWGLMKKRHIVILVLLALILVLCLVCNSSDTTTTTTTAPAGRTMYFCGYDRCKDSGEYGQVTFSSGINIWNGPDPNRGGVLRTAKHREKVTVVQEQRVSTGPGGLWYKLSGGGWTNDLWLTDDLCGAGNLERLSFSDCLLGKY